MTAPADTSQNGKNVDPSNEFAKLERDLMKQTGRCISDFSLIEEGDRVMVCLSGGKDSYTMMRLLDAHRKRAPIHFDLIVVHLDQGHPGYDGSPLRNWLSENKYDHRIVSEDTYSIVKEKVPEGKTYCSLCSRLRRGVLYNVAQELGCTKIALGHHRDDSLETLMLNLMFTGQIKAMPPKLRSDDGRNVVIRPLLYCAETTIARYAQLSAFPILPCDLCGSQEQLMRKQVKNMITQMETMAPQVRESMLAALTNVRPTHLLDRNLWQQLNIDQTRMDDEHLVGHPKDETVANSSAKSAPLPSRPLPSLLGSKRLPVISGEG